VFVLGADSPLRPRYNIATAQLLPNATYQIETPATWSGRRGPALSAVLWTASPPGPGSHPRSVARLGHTPEPSNRPRTQDLTDK